MKETLRNLYRMNQCPHYEACGAVKCPLDELAGQRKKRAEDKETCRLGKAVRLRLGRDLPNRGLTLQEAAALRRSYGLLERGIEANFRRNFNRKKRREGLGSQ